MLIVWKSDLSGISYQYVEASCKGPNSSVQRAGTWMPSSGLNPGPAAFQAVTLRTHSLVPISENEVVRTSPSRLA